MCYGDFFAVALQGNTAVSGCAVWSLTAPVRGVGDMQCVLCYVLRVQIMEVTPSVMYT